MREHLIIIKVGGQIVEEEGSLRTLLKDFSRIAGGKILVHGGGKSATALSEKLGIEKDRVFTHIKEMMRKNLVEIAGHEERNAVFRRK